MDHHPSQSDVGRSASSEIRPFPLMKGAGTIARVIVVLTSSPLINSCGMAKTREYRIGSSRRRVGLLYNRSGSTECEQSSPASEQLRRSASRSDRYSPYRLEPIANRSVRTRSITIRVSISLSVFSPANSVFASPRQTRRPLWDVHFYRRSLHRARLLSIDPSPFGRWQWACVAIWWHPQSLF